MTVTLEKLLSNTASVEVSYGEDTITLEYYPGKVTEETLASLSKLAKAKDEDAMVEGFRTLNTVLCSLIKSWDIMSGEQMLPVTMEYLPQLPVMLRARMSQAILKDFRPEA